MTLKARVKTRISAVVRPSGKLRFILGLPPHATILDVGCGNNGPAVVKGIRPDVRYIGLDIHDYRIDAAAKSMADQYILANGSAFAAAIEEVGTVDAVISSHNIEHCYDWRGVLTAIMAVMRTGATLYLSTPCAESVHFPSRRGTLNFYDDDTHRAPIPATTLEQVLSERMEIVHFHPRYRPPLLLALGLIVEPLSAAKREVMRGTWALWGFESVIWAVKR